MPRNLVAVDYSYHERPDHVLLRFAEDVPDLVDRCRRVFVRWLESQDGAELIANHMGPENAVHWRDIACVPSDRFLAEGLTVLVDDPTTSATVEDDDNLLSYANADNIEHAPGCVVHTLPSAECSCSTAEAREIVREAGGDTYAAN